MYPLAAATLDPFGTIYHHYMCLNNPCTHNHPLGIKLNLLLVKVLRLLLCQLLHSDSLTRFCLDLVCRVCPYLLLSLLFLLLFSFLYPSSFSTFLVSFFLFPLFFCFFSSFSLNIASPSALVKTHDSVTLVSAGIY